MQIARAFVTLLVILASAATAAAQQAVILVRHGEKVDQSKDAGLSDAGHARARALAALLARAGVRAIYATQYQRTIKTAEPLAVALKLPVESVPADDAATLVSRLKTRHAGDVVLVVGHSNTVPDIMRRLGHTVDEPIPDDDFGSVFVLVPRQGAAPLVLRLSY